MIYISLYIFATVLLQLMLRKWRKCTLETDTTIWYGKTAFAFCFFLLKVTRLNYDVRAKKFRLVKRMATSLNTVTPFKWQNFQHAESLWCQGSLEIFSAPKDPVSVMSVFGDIPVLSGICRTASSILTVCSVQYIAKLSCVVWTH